METELPSDALLARYEPPHYTDCFAVDYPSNITLGQFVYAFYTAPLFRCERIILKLIGRGSTDEQAQQLVDNERNTFAAWSVEDRTDDQLLMCDFQSRTRSWFKAESRQDSTRLYFGSAVTSDGDHESHESPPSNYRILLRLHRQYSRLLLKGAIRRLKRTTPS